MVQCQPRPALHGLLCRVCVCVCSKSSEKRDKEAALKQAVADARLWEMRFQAAEKSRHTYRESSHKLVQENNHLQSAISQVSPHYRLVSWL